MTAVPETPTAVQDASGTWWSRDGRYRWDGSRWQQAEPAVPPPPPAEKGLDRGKNPVFVRVCERCRKKTWWQYGQAGGTNYSVSFISVATIGSKPAVTCPKCRSGLVLTGGAEKLGQELATLNRDLMAGKIGLSRYREGCASNLLWLRLADREGSLPPVSPDGRFFWDGRKWRPSEPLTL